MTASLLRLYLLRQVSDDFGAGLQVTPVLNQEKTILNTILLLKLYERTRVACFLTHNVQYSDQKARRQTKV